MWWLLLLVFVCCFEFGGVEFLVYCYDDFGFVVVNFFVGIEVGVM